MGLLSKIFGGGSSKPDTQSQELQKKQQPQRTDVMQTLAERSAGDGFNRGSFGEADNDRRAARRARWKSASASNSQDDGSGFGG